MITSEVNNMPTFLSVLTAYATDAAATTAADTALGGNSWISTLILIVAMVAVFYFLIIRPQKKRDKQARDMRSSVKVGDEIVTIGGVCGKVTNVKDDTITIISAESKMTFLKTSVASVTSPDSELGQ
jgi:preprotein translocase subunit YajC